MFVAHFAVIFLEVRLTTLTIAALCSHACKKNCYTNMQKPARHACMHAENHLDTRCRLPLQGVINEQRAATLKLKEFARSLLGGNKARDGMCLLDGWPGGVQPSV